MLEDVGAPMMLFKIGKLWTPGMDEDQVYDAVRGYWRVGAAKRQQVQYALAIAGGCVRGAYRIDAWSLAAKVTGTGSRTPLASPGVVSTASPPSAAPDRARRPAPLYARPGQSRLVRRLLALLAQVLHGLRQQLVEQGDPVDRLHVLQTPFQRHQHPVVRERLVAVQAIGAREVRVVVSDGGSAPGC